MEEKDEHLEIAIRDGLTDLLCDEVELAFKDTMTGLICVAYWPMPKSNHLWGCIMIPEEWDIEGIEDDKLVKHCHKTQEYDKYVLYSNSKYIVCFDCLNVADLGLDWYDVESIPQKYHDEEGFIPEDIRERYQKIIYLKKKCSHLCKILSDRERGKIGQA